MKVVIAPDSYKESLAAPEVARQIEAGFREVFPDASYRLVPLADGGEGTTETMVAATDGRLIEVSVTGPLGRPVTARYGLTGDGRTAVVEMAAASGLMLVPPAERNPLLASSYGTGELLRAALAAGVSRLLVGIGGSATNDGGAGMLQALGLRLVDGNGREIGFGGGALARLERIDARDMEPRLAEVEIEVACDVQNPLLGPTGASAVFGPQKGATPAMVDQLDVNLAHYAALLSRDLGVDVAAVPGAGAAGGMGAALLALGGRLRPGIDLVMETVGFEEIVRDADLVVTGEGRIDSQTASGKAPLGVARVARRLGKPVVVIAGSVGADADVVHEYGIDALFSVLSQPVTLAEALAGAAANIRRTARNVAAAVRVGQGMR